jgi:putative oxidoreductase
MGMFRALGRGLIAALFVTAVRANAALQILAAAVFAGGKATRAAAAVLAASLVPTTLVGHPFWTYEDPAQRGPQFAHFAKNLAIIGGLILAAVPSHAQNNQ